MSTSEQGPGLELTEVMDPDLTTCHHPPARRFAWFARDDAAPGGQVLCVACCDCGAVVQGGAILASGPE